MVILMREAELLFLNRSAARTSGRELVNPAVVLSGTDRRVGNAVTWGGLRSPALPEDQPTTKSRNYPAMTPENGA